VVAQPQADQVAAAVGVGMVLELGAGVAEHPVIDELQLAGFKVEIGRQGVVVEQFN